ncbi:MAG: hypothetical protein IPM39_23365 [Chloroflexi bacterium]|nr:hypothetical protein [Chloroflexota bacterium]
MVKGVELQAANQPVDGAFDGQGYSFQAVRPGCLLRPPMGEGVGRTAVLRERPDSGVQTSHMALAAPPTASQDTS